METQGEEDGSAFNSTPRRQRFVVLTVVGLTRPRTTTGTTTKADAITGINMTTTSTTKQHVDITLSFVVWRLSEMDRVFRCGMLWFMVP